MRCKAKKPDGARCTLTASTEVGLFARHDPALADMRARAARAGGRAAQATRRDRRRLNGPDIAQGFAVALAQLVREAVRQELRSLLGGGIDARR